MMDDSALEGSPISCVFCCCSIINDEESLEESGAIVGRFVTLLGRYVGRGLEEKVGNGVREASGGRSIGGACLECVKDLKLFTELYCEMERIKLEMDWRLDALAKKMELKGGGERLTGEHVLDEKVKAFRSGIIRACGDKRSNANPKVVLEEPKKATSLGVQDPPNDISMETEATSSHFDDDFMVTSDNDEERSSEHPEQVEVKYTPSDTIPQEEVPVPGPSRKPSQSSSHLPSNNLNDGTVKKGNKSPCVRIICPLCSISIGTKFHMLRHLRVVHSLSDEDARSTFPKCRFKKTKVAEKSSDEKSEESPSRFPFKCSICPRAFKLNKTLLTHLRNYHQQPIPFSRNLERFPCPVCSKTIANKKGLRKHLRKFHPSEAPPKVLKAPEYPCPTSNCSEAFSSEDDLQKHQQLHGSFKCLFCEVTKTYAPDLSLHELEAHTDSGDQCPRCPHTSATKTHLISHHVESHLGLSLKVTTCEICQAPFRSSNYPRKHFKIFHDTSGLIPSQIHRCDLCPAYFIRIFQLSRHKLQIHGIDPGKKCRLCGKVFAVTERLHLHLRTVHKFDDESPDLPESCDVEGCKKRFFTREELEWHKCFYRHKKGESYKLEPCPECQKMFTVQGLQRHLKTHRKGDHICEQCGLGFKKKSTLTNHYLFHKGPEGWEYQCQECGKKCATVHHLNEHLRVHSGVKPYECKVCGRKFSNRENLRHHVNSKHKAEGVEDVPRRKAKPKFISRRKVVEPDLQPEATSSSGAAIPPTHSKLS